VLREKPDFQYNCTPMRSSARVVPFSSLAELDVSIVPIPEFLAEHQIGTSSFSCNIDSKKQFAVRLEEENAADFFPGTDLLVRSGETPENGMLVLARIRNTDEVVIARYERKNKNICLYAPRSEKVLYTWDCLKSAGYMLWCLVIQEAKSDFRIGER